MREDAIKLADSSKVVTRSSLAFLSGTFISRFTGLGRDMSMAFCFGSHPAIAAFMVAFRFANLIRRLFGEGPLSSGFIPYFEGIRKESPVRGAQFFRDLFISLTVFLCFFIGVTEVALIALWKWGQFTVENREILYLSILMLPGIVFICLFGLSSGLLQCERKFFLTGLAPVAFNVVWIAAAWWFKDRAPSEAMAYLSGAVVIAFLMQWAMVAPHTVRFLRHFLSWKECVSAQLFSKEMRQVLKPFLLGVIGVSAVQINSALDAVFARAASLEGPAYLWYAIRLQQLPLALFGIALSAALLPSLSRMVKDHLEEYNRLMNFAFRRSFSLIFPCTIGIFVLGASAVNLIYGRGDFSNEATYQTVICLFGYGIGLVPSVLLLLLAPSFYSKKNYATPMRGSLYAVILNALLSAFFVFSLEWGAFSIAVATSVSAWVNYLYLSYHSCSIWDKELTRSCVKTTGATLIAGAVTLMIGAMILDDPTYGILKGGEGVVFARAFFVQFLQFLGLVGTFSLVLLSCAWMLKAQDLLSLVGLENKRS